MEYWLLCGTAGEYEDFHTWVVALYEDKARAEEDAAAMNHQAEAIAKRYPDESDRGGHGVDLDPGSDHPAFWCYGPPQYCVRDEPAKVRV